MLFAMLVAEQKPSRGILQLGAESPRLDRRFSCLLRTPTKCAAPPPIARPRAVAARGARTRHMHRFHFHICLPRLWPNIPFHTHPRKLQDVPRTAAIAGKQAGRCRFGSNAPLVFPLLPENGRGPLSQRPALAFLYSCHTRERNAITHSNLNESSARVLSPRACSFQPPTNTLHSQWLTS
eukprot:COSAG06_NODE_191_length_20709_cov_8.536778_7_plen_180_part_00